MTVDGIELGRFRFWGQSIDERDVVFARLRAEQPVAYHSRLDSLPGTPPGRGFWSVTKWADVRAVNRNPRVFSPVDGIRMDDSLDPETNEFFSSIIVMEDPRHAKLRMLVQKRFTPSTIAALEECPNARPRAGGGCP